MAGHIRTCKAPLTICYKPPLNLLTCLPTYLLSQTQLPTYPPSCLPTYSPTNLLACLPTCLPTCLLADLTTNIPAYLSTYSATYLPGCLLTCLPINPLGSLPTVPKLPLHYPTLPHLTLPELTLSGPTLHHLLTRPPTTYLPIYRLTCLQIDLVTYFSTYQFTTCLLVHLATIIILTMLSNAIPYLVLYNLVLPYLA